MAGRGEILALAETAPPAYVESPFKTNFASLSLHKTDRIRLLHFPPEIVATIRDIIKNNWHSGIQEEGAHAGWHEFKCQGTPWTGQGADAIHTRNFMRSMLACLFSRGWILLASTDVFKPLVEMDTMVFRKQSFPPPESEWIAISFHQGDKLRLIGAPTELVAAFQALLNDMSLLQEASSKDEALNTFEFKINGRPWWRREENMTIRLLLLRMLETLEAGGWSLYTTVDHSFVHDHSPSSSTGTDAWYCVRAVDWVPGNSVFHR